MVQARRDERGSSLGRIPRAPAHRRLPVACGGVSLAVVSRILGRSDPGFTLRVYVHALPSDLPDGEALAQAVGLGGAASWASKLRRSLESAR